MIAPAASPGRRWRWVVASAVAFLLLAYAAYRIANARCFSLTGDLTCRVETSEPLVALTLDDGPTPAGADYALAVLGRFNAKATFFLIGQDIEKHPDHARRIYEAGHELANHSYSHQRMIVRSTRFYEEEIARTDALLRKVGGMKPTLFRPPFGKKLVGLPLAARRQGYRMVMIDVEEPLDVGDDPRAYANRIVREARPGSIILMHVMYRSNETARRAMPLVIAGLQARGLRVVTVGELMKARAGEI